jgi:hypothetical protein
VVYFAAFFLDNCVGVGFFFISCLCSGVIFFLWCFAVFNILCGDCDVVFYALLGSTGFIDLVPFFAYAAASIWLRIVRNRELTYFLGAPLAQGGTKERAGAPDWHALRSD